MGEPGEYAMPADPAAVKSLFLEAAGIDEPSARAALLVERAGADAELLARVNALLAAHDRVANDRATASFDSSPDGSTADFPGKDKISLRQAK